MSFSEYTVGIYTLGCKVNQYESEAIAEAFSMRGFCVQAPTQTCNVYVINTCTVTAESDRKARQFIRRAIHKNPNAYILVTGCFSQTQPQQIAAIEGVDHICGNADKLSVVQETIKLIEQGKKNTFPTISTPLPDSKGFEKMSISHFDRTRAYIKIEDGCESHCTYCIIPHARGAIRSKSPCEVIEEVRRLTESGCKEVVLTGIETASYGKDLDGYGLADLLCEIDRIPGIGRVRLGSLDPSLIKQPFVDRISALRSLAPHFHLSMQSGSDHILALMKRKYNSRMALEGIQRLRKALPDVQFTTDIIVGFPNESEEDFEKTRAFIQMAKFLMVHVFPYSKRSGTPAATMSGQVPETIKHERVKILSDTQNEIRKTLLQAHIGTCAEVLFESYKNGYAIGHTKSFIEVACPASAPMTAELRNVHLCAVEDGRCLGKITN